MLELPKGITMKFLKKEAKKGILNHISNMKRNGNFTLSQIGKQIKRGCINLNDWSVEEDPTWWRHDESFVHSLAGQTWLIDHRGWFRHRLAQYVVFKNTFQDEPFQKNISTREARSPLEFILASWINQERQKWSNKQMGYTTVNDWKYLQMKESKIPMKIRYRATENRKRWDQIWNDFFLPIFHTYNASNNQEDYFTVQIQTNRKKKNRGCYCWIWSTQFAIDFPAKKFKSWRENNVQYLKGNFQRGNGGAANYEKTGYRYKQLALIGFLGVPRSQLNS